MQGYVQVYTGSGKGKTTAALGLAIRAVGAGKKVFFAQFIKGKIYSEIKTIQALLPSITIKQYGMDCFIEKAPTRKDITAARKGLEEVEHVIEAGEYDIVVLDEACIALYYNLFSVDELLTVLRKKPRNMEIIVTGRKAPKELVDLADLVTEMNEIKHYYQKGVEAREGIEF